MGNGRTWETWESELLKTQYADTSTRALSSLLDRSPSSVYGRAAQMGLKKSQAYLASPDACRLRRGDNVGSRTRFQPGQMPHNKGLRRPGWSPGRMAETQFKPGHKPHTWKPIGSTRYSKEGYLQRKVSDTGYPPKDWKGEHIILWEKAHGAVPEGHAVAFRDRDKTHITVDNFELLSRAELMRRNTIHNYPQELAGVIRLSAKLKRKLRSLHEEHSD